MYKIVIEKDGTKTEVDATQFFLVFEEATGRLGVAARASVGILSVASMIASQNAMASLAKGSGEEDTHETP
ncbi:hypothetical protein [Candidatus Igneacidithiobacillus taiwanensis]|uniref:hypothetical protein n=1 Tax=Candidatus Igneacidithiobacillus taiwanensis TaxID=1945924 RepID=UPI00289AC7E7|nr:hypothetical protein [Candidatus Igneacidithiobacillus taiwanensis]